MAEAILLGTGRAVPTRTQENTYLVLAGEQHTLMVDCGGSPFRRLLKAGVSPTRLTAMILTHFHPDHVYGAPSLLLATWVAGRRAPLDVYGPEDTLARLRALMDLHQIGSWPEMYPIRYHPVALETGAPVLENEDFAITAAPGQHFIPVIGLRVFNRRSGAALVYGADTEPCEAIQTLAKDADILIHEATGERPGHSSAAQAGAVAAAAGVRHLALVHYDVEATPRRLLRAQALAAFDGKITVARDFTRLAW